MIRPKQPKMTTAESKRGYTLVAERSFGECEGCGHAGATQMHHRLYRSHGGQEQPWNLLHLCLYCHAQAHKDGQNRGWAVPSGFDPASIPVLYRGQWMLLTGDGGLKDGGDNAVVQSG